MKSLLAGLLVIAAVGFAHADALKLDAPVEARVVEIHMSTKIAPELAESTTRKRRVVSTMPLPGRGTCSGSFIDSSGDIITAKHCVEGFDYFDVQTSDQRHFAATVIATSTVHDLALIHIDRRNTPFFELAENFTRGETVFVLGSPLGITDTLSTGVIARIDGDVVMLDCGALPGNSGGPVFNKDAKLVGVLNAGFIVMFGVTHLNMAQSLDAVTYFLVEALEKKNHGR